MGAALMITPTFKLIGLHAAYKALERAEKQSRFAIVRALTKTAKDVQTELVGEMKAKFDRPTPWTLRSTFVKPATRQSMMAIVGIKDMAAAKATASAANLLGHQFRGGGRNLKRLERWLIRAGRMGSDEFVAPGAGVRLDQYGNMSRGQVAQIMSQLRLGADAASWSSGSARSKRNVSRAGRIFWSRGSGRASHLRRGAWIDMGQPIGLRPLLIVIKRPNYRARINLPQIAQQTIAKKWDDNLKSAVATTFSTAR